jgi:hypothetical protein
MALLLTSVFGVTGCGSDDDVQAESRVKNAAPEVSGVSDASSKADCDLLDLYDLNDLYDLDLSDDLNDRLDLGGLDDLLDRLDDPDFRDFLDNRLEQLGQCAAALRSGNYAPEGDDVDGG